jgi:hypothetical protein
MSKYVTIRCIAAGDTDVWLSLTGHYNERTGESLPDTDVVISRERFAALAADHPEPIPADFFESKRPVRVSEPA